MQYATFHLFFDDAYLPTKLPKASVLLEEQFICPETEPYIVEANSRRGTFKKRKRLSYPVNVARNLARDSAMTYFVLASDIELYPSPNLVKDFFNMIHKNSTSITKGNKYVSINYQILSLFI